MDAENTSVDTAEDDLPATRSPRKKLQSTSRTAKMTKKKATKKKLEKETKTVTL